MWYIDQEGPANKKRKKSRWGSEESRTVIPGMPTVIPPNMSEGQQKLYLSNYKYMYILIDTCTLVVYSLSFFIILFYSYLVYKWSTLLNNKYFYTCTCICQLLINYIIY